MKSIFLTICFFIVFNFYGQQQNLIPNQSFELSNGCPTGTNQLQLLENWFNPNEGGGGTADYFDTCAIPGGVGIPNNSMGYQKARNGKAYVGIIVAGFMPNSLIKTREYVATKLTKSLEKGYSYKLTFYINLADYLPYAVSKADIGVYFSKDTLDQNSSPLYTLLSHPPIVAGDTNSFFEDTLNWIKVEMIYKAKGGEKFMALGNFNDYVHTHTKVLDTTKTLGLGYYYLDDFSLYEFEKKSSYGLKIDSLQFLSPCYDSISIKITNSGDSALDFVKHPFILNLEVKQNGVVVQTLQKTIQDNKGNPFTGDPLAVDSSFWVYFSGITYPMPTGNYTIEVSSQMAADGDSTNNFADTTFYRAISVGNMSISDSSICLGESLQLYSKNVKGMANWQFSPNKQNWQTIGSGDTLVYTPKESGFFRLQVCEFFSDTLPIKVKPLPAVINQEFQFCSPGQEILKLDKNDSISNINWYKTAKNGLPFHQGFSFSTMVSNNVTYYLESIKDKCASKERGILKITIGGCTLEIPNIFTPNGDGINDIFEYRQSYGKEIKTTIYNRWGKNIEEFTGASGWTGKGYPAGTYYYVIKADGEVYRGSVMLVR